MTKLVIKGGVPIRTKKFPAYNTIGEEEKKAVQRVLDSGVLSKFLGTWGPDFYGGPEVRAFEKEWAKFFGSKYAITVNSCTSGLYCAVGATNLGPGDEVIVSPYTMSASVVAPLIFNAIPVFADIEDDYFCLSPDSIREKISERTKAIIVVDIFGQSYDLKEINKIAEEHNLTVIRDCAQAPYTKYHGQLTGNHSDINVFSLNYHKHIHTGEGGVITTNDDKIAEKLYLIRNHAESVVEGKGVKDIVNCIGFNFRMTEIEAAIGRCQLKKLKSLVEKRQRNAKYLSKRIGSLEGITAPKIREKCTHSFYVMAFKFDENKIGISRERFIEAVRAEIPETELREGEGALIGVGYEKPLYLLPLFQKKICYGNKGFPFTSKFNESKVRYDKGICPVAERLHEKELFTLELMRPPMTKEDLDDVARAFEKVYENINELK